MIRAADKSEEKINNESIEDHELSKNHKIIQKCCKHGLHILTAKNKWIQLAIAAEELTPRRCQVLELARASS